jgi:hypothetical protein
MAINLITENRFIQTYLLIPIFKLVWRKRLENREWISIGHTGYKSTANDARKEWIETGGHWEITKNYWKVKHVYGWRTARLDNGNRGHRCTFCFWIFD